MDELYNIIGILFRKILPKQIIGGKYCYNKIPLDLLEKISYAYEDNADEAEIHKRLQFFKSQVQFQLYEEQNYIADSESFNVFDLVEIFVRMILEARNGEVVCRFRYLQEWRQVTNKVENTVFLAAMYARMDYENGKIRRSFIWPDIIGHNNVQLNRILSDGISDNHFHLLGSVHYFSLSWLMLMNHVNEQNFVRQMDEMDNQRRNPRIRLSYDYEEDKFKIQHLQAALIRVYLFSELTGRYIELGTYYASWEKIISYISQKSNGSIYEFALEYRNAIQYGMACEQYPEYCWLFQKIFNEKPAGVIEKELERLLAERDFTSAILDLAQKSGNISLKECTWLYKNNLCEYEKEWREQTQTNVWRLLRNTSELLDFRMDLQIIIDSLLDKVQHINCDYAADGAGAWYDTDESQSLLIGERWLEYKMFRDRELLSENHFNLFYVYLLIKESFRMEIQQSNEKLGFANFHKYQRRKGMFTSYYTYGELARAAIEASVRQQNIKSIEVRISFGESCAEDAELIRYYDREIQQGCLKEYADKYYYVMGFGKRVDNFRQIPSEYGHMFYRHYDLRARIRKEADGLIQLRRKNPEMAQRIKGIDAFSDEDGCRPEVFATVYRVLKKHSCYRGLSIKPEVPPLRETYHVGEVFTDIVDGLRAVDEAVHFLNLDCGDRLGHATVLGMDVEKWYEDCNFKISIRRMDYLDNVVWLYYKLLRYHIPDTDTLLQYLEIEFEKYFALIYSKFIGEGYIEDVARRACEYGSGYSEKYGSQIARQADQMSEAGQRRSSVYDFRYGIVRKNDGSIYDFNIRNYYYSWMLRGDHPGLYENGFYEQQLNVKSIWDECSVNREFPKDQRIRYILPAAVLNHFYHYNTYVRESGEKAETVKIPVNMVKAISLIQKAMQFELAQREIAIETNPSSNLMINRISSYDKHPIFKLYNMGLTHDVEKLEECPQLNVSINTDDQGVFATCLSNEYALVASSLSRMVDSDGNHVYKRAEIYQWIKNVQEMSNNQSFLKAEPRDEEGY